MSLIDLNQMVKTYQIGETVSTVLKGISLKVDEGELLAIVGASGSGKSTLMNIIGFLDKADSGEYYLKGRNTEGLHQDELAILRNQNIGFIFQQFNLLPRLNAYHNVALPLTYRGCKRDEIHEKVMKALQHVNMAQYKEHLPAQLSGGQQQRIAIARALVTDPEVLLADEPTGALDSKTGEEIMALFLSLHKDGRTIILVTHDSKVAALCNRRITFADGMIISDERECATVQLQTDGLILDES